MSQKVYTFIDLIDCSETIYIIFDIIPLKRYYDSNVAYNSWSMQLPMFLSIAEIREISVLSESECFK